MHDPQFNVKVYLKNIIKCILEWRKLLKVKQLCNLHNAVVYEENEESRDARGKIILWIEIFPKQIMVSVVISKADETSTFCSTKNQGKCEVLL